MHTHPKNTAEGMSVITDGEASSRSRQCAEYGTVSPTPMNKLEEYSTKGALEKVRTRRNLEGHESNALFSDN
jgi:hypothetical protein